MLEVLLFSGGIKLKPKQQVINFYGKMQNGATVGFYTYCGQHNQLLEKIALAIGVKIPLSHKYEAAPDYAICFGCQDIDFNSGKKLILASLAEINSDLLVKKQTWLELKNIFL